MDRSDKSVTMRHLFLCWISVLVTPVICNFCHEGIVSNANIMSKEFSRDDLFPGRTVFQILGVSSWIYCSRLCLLRSVCKSLVYDDIAGNCTGYTVTAIADELKDSLTKSYSEINNIPQSIAGPCAAHTCGYHEVCVPEGYNGFHCTVVGRCSSAPSLPNSEIQTFVENKMVTYTCSSNYNNVKSHPEYTSWCIGENRWTPTMFKCVFSESPD